MLMLLFTLIALVATIFNSIVLVSNSRDQDVVKNLDWSHGAQKDCSGSNCVDVYVGIHSIVTKVSGSTFTTNWDSNACTPDYCDKCEETMPGVVAFSAAALAFGVVSIFTNCKRNSAGGNSGTNRSMGAFTSFLSMVCALVCIIWFYADCQKEVYDDTHDSLDWKFGSAWILMLIVAILKFVDMIGNLALSAGTV